MSYHMGRQILMAEISEWRNLPDAGHRPVLPLCWKSRIPTTARRSPPDEQTGPPWCRLTIRLHHAEDWVADLCPTPSLTRSDPPQSTCLARSGTIPPSPWRQTASPPTDGNPLKLHALVTPMAVRNATEDIHAEHLTDEQMGRLIPT
jgi:hypothetical protein